MTDSHVTIYEEWRDEQEADVSYLIVFNELNQIAEEIRQRPDVGAMVVANALMNLHARALAAMTPTDEQVAQMAAMFGKAVMALRDNTTAAASPGGRPEVPTDTEAVRYRR